MQLPKDLEDTILAHPGTTVHRKPVRLPQESPRIASDKPLTEKAFLARVLLLARAKGWLVAHFRPARTAKGWRTAVQGDGKGFPDLVLIRPPRVIFAECKTDKGQTTEEQENWLGWLRCCPGIEVYVWRPRRWEEIGTILETA